MEAVIKNAAEWPFSDLHLSSRRLKERQPQADRKTES